MPVFACQAVDEPSTLFDDAIPEHSTTQHVAPAGARANGVLASALATVRPGLVDELDRYDNPYIKLRGDATAGELHEALRAAREAFGDDLARASAPVSEDAVKQLKFAELLPPALAAATLSARAADRAGSRAVAGATVMVGT